MQTFRSLESVADFYIDNRLILPVAVLSSGLGFAALANSASLVATAALILLPWLALVARKLRGDWTRYGVLAIFELLVFFQLAHFAEHLAQVVEIHWLDWANARGIIGELDIEPVHFWWNTTILAAGAALLLHYGRNKWLWASFLFSAWHEVEHLYIYFVWYLGQGVSGHPGILGADGLLDQANISIPVLTQLGRADLHFWYNLFEIGLFLVAYVVQARRASAPAPQSDAGSEGVAPSAAEQARSGAGIVLAPVQITLMLALALVLHSPPALRVPEDYATIQQAIDFAPGGAIIRIAPGTYPETLLINKPLTLMGAPDGATRIGTDHSADAIITVHANNVTLQNLNVVNGNYGILVEESQGVNILNNQVGYAWFAGIRLSRASATLIGNSVRQTLGSYGMGIELANTVSRPPSLIRQNTISTSAHEGIVLHNARATIELNKVSGNGLRGISIAEMSEATVRANTLDDNADAGIYVVDSSMAEVFGNRIAGVRAGPLGDAQGIRADFNAEVMLGSNDIDSDSQNAVVARSGAVIERP